MHHKNYMDVNLPSPTNTLVLHMHGKAKSYCNQGLHLNKVLYPYEHAPLHDRRELASQLLAIYQANDRRLTYQVTAVPARNILL